MIGSESRLIVGGTVTDPSTAFGNEHPGKFRHGICAAGHKAMWHDSWGGLPIKKFLSAVSPTLDGGPFVSVCLMRLIPLKMCVRLLNTRRAEKLGLPVGFSHCGGRVRLSYGGGGAGAANMTWSK